MAEEYKNKVNILYFLLHPYFFVRNTDRNFLNLNNWNFLSICS